MKDKIYNMAKYCIVYIIFIHLYYTLYNYN